MTRAEPMAVLRPASTDDVARLVRSSYESAHGFSVSARDHGHLINGQAQRINDVVVQMSGSRGKPLAPEVIKKLMYMNVWAGELWIDVLKTTNRCGQILSRRLQKEVWM